MSFVRGSSICRQRRKVLLLARSLSGSAVKEGVSLAELAEKPPSSSSATEPLFGIAPRKLRNEEDEDFVSRSTSSQFLDSSLSSQQNYFSQTWAEQKHGLPLKSYHPADEQSDIRLVSPYASANVSLQQGTSTQRSAPSRVWLAEPDSQASTQETFTFASFKVLASEVARRHKGQLYHHVPSWMFAWNTRRRKILACPDLCFADIICLQEVDQFRDLESEFSRRGYAGLYKSSQSKAMNGSEPYGCAIFWRKARFRLLHEESLDFSSLGMKQNVAQLCVLQSTVPGNPDMGTTSDCQSKRLLVGNIDVLFNPKRGDIKLGQCRAFLQQAHKLSNLWPGARLVIGGCFYLTPQSSIYSFLANSKLDVHGLERQYLSGQVRLPVCPVGKGTEQSGATNSMVATLPPAGRVGESSDPSLDLKYQRLRKSLTAKFASMQQSPARDFADSAKEVLSRTSSAGFASLSTRVSNDDGCINEKEHNQTKELISKTIDILEGCIKSPAGVDAAGAAISWNESAKTGASVSSNASSTLSSVLVGSRMELSCKNCTDGQTEIMLSDSDRIEGSNEEGSSSNISVPSGSSPSTAADCVSGHSSLNQHGWDPEDLKVATGSADITMVEHDLKLFSVYPEIQGGNRHTRDEKGEPQVTMFHSEFKGTVDYIWRSEGLKTAKVLDTFCIADMLTTPALTFMAYGSDHIHLACELAFTSVNQPETCS